MEKLSEGMKQYADNLDALREFIEVLAPALQERSFLEQEQGRAKADQLLIMALLHESGVRVLKWCRLSG